MSATHSEIEPRLQELPIDVIDPNEHNPRLVFPQDELDRLAESIDLEGILVPIVVFPRDDRYILVDGERRYRCAQMLGLDTIPAVVTSELPDRDVLVRMFNIHLVREPWRDIPTAKALRRLIDDFEAEGQVVSDKQLKELTGLSIDRVRQLRYVTTLPPEWQDYINEGTIPLNFFWELKKSVIDVLASKRPVLMNEFGEAGLAQAFVEKRLEGVISDTVSLRKVRLIINFARSDVVTDEEPSLLDANIRDLITNRDLTIEEVYEDTVQIMVEASQLERRTRTMLVSFGRLLDKARTPEERARIVSIGDSFVKELKKVIARK